ncbi:TatD deoxyribonuclease-like protein [Hamiltosporidium magnivora]|uniref:TatD deoxyribonuclease-like protein n=2 Tax=Hamiltosporidium magnivora TaxID=148818 RepID=A0A4Q9LNY2_9MICR|nr:TatD deoxyribonuclease-like protein [Hamiltosporidium magnivora]
MIIDIAMNIADKAFQNDVENVIERTFKNNIIPFFVGTNYETSIQCINYADKYNTFSYAGIHPANATKNKSDIKMFPLRHSKVIGIGECGLDYDRLLYTSKEDQKCIFKEQLEFKEHLYFLHSRNCHRDFMEILSDYNINGVVHSFTGTCEEMKDIIKKGLYIGINGCSLKYEENLEFIKEVPLERVLLETDAPYCKISKSYAGYKYVQTFFKENKKGFGCLKKGRNEPVNIRQVLEVLCYLKELCPLETENFLLENACKLFGSKLETLIKEKSKIT